MKVELIDFKELPEYPSGSAIEFYNDDIYLIGDDARDILVMNKKWKEKSRISLFKAEDHSTRISKELKADLEAAVITEAENLPYLLLIGSGSVKDYREKSFLVDLSSMHITEQDMKSFYAKIAEAGVKDLNIEACALVKDHTVFSNRANNSNPENQLIITRFPFENNMANDELTILNVEFPFETEQVIGISGMTYGLKNDCLVFTASTENTENPYDDGHIGDSYLGIIENASRKIGRKKMKVNEMVNLSEVSRRFEGAKVESVCIQSEKNGRMKLHMTADNDNGTTLLYKVRLKI